MSPPAVATPDAPIFLVDHRPLPDPEGAVQNVTITLVDHRHLPDTDGTLQNFQQQPQNDLLTGSLMPRLQQLYPDGMFAIGQDAGIYWRLTTPFLDGCKAPDWFFVPGVPPMLDGMTRRSYVLWQEAVRPLIVMEFVSGDGSEEHDKTPYKGKFWVYEQAIAAPYYVIFDFETPSLELYEAPHGRYLPVAANAAGRYPVEPLGVELGIWKGDYRNQDMHWLRFWDSATGEMLLNAEEREAIEFRRAEAERKRAEEAESVAEFKGRELTEECERAEAERKRANEAATQRDAESRRADDAAKQRDTESRRADEAANRAALLAERLRALGIDPDDAAS